MSDTPTESPPEIPTEPLIDASRVEEILIDCLPEKEEGVFVEGILHNYMFAQEKLDEHRDEVKTMLQNLPKEFRLAEMGGGGGWSFLQACQDANNMQWTGLHRTMEHLFVLGIALDFAAWTLPRDMWGIFPGQMPYVVVKV